MGTKDKRTGKGGDKKVGTQFDDFEDAFFATGDSSGFWDEGDGPRPPGSDLEGGEGVEAQSESAPAGEAPAEETPVEEAPPEEPLAEDDPSVEIAATPVDRIVVEDETPAYDPRHFLSNIKGESGVEEIQDQPTEVWNPEDMADGLLDAPTVIEEPEEPEEAAASRDYEEARTIYEEPEEAPEAPVLPDLGASEPGSAYVPAASSTEGWSRAADALEAEAAHLSGEEQGAVLAEAARIRLERSDQWEASEKLFASALATGLPLASVAKNYADVVANQGQFTQLRDLLVARAGKLDGAAAAEALQDAALVERNNLNDLGAAIELLQKALKIREDWFTLRLLRELQYREEDWAGLVSVLERMAKLCSGPRAARLRVEQGRILEAETGDLAAAAKAYGRARQADATSDQAFLGAARVAGALEDWASLAKLYADEAKRLGGADGQFWIARAARVARDGGMPTEKVAAYYIRATKNAGAENRTIHHEAQAFLAQGGQWEAMAGALAREAAVLDGGAKALVLYRLGQVQEHQLGNHDAATRSFQAALEADPSAGPAADAAIRLLGSKGEVDKALALLKSREARVDDGVVAASAAFRMGEICEMLADDCEAAISHYQRAANHDANHPFALGAVARVAKRLGQWDTAASALKSLAKSAEEPTACARLWFQAGQLLAHRLGDAKGATAAFKASSESAPQNPAALDALVALWEDANDLDALAKALVSASQMLPTAALRAEAGYRAARILVDQLDDLTGSVECLQRCLEDSPGCMPAVALLCTLSAKTGAWQVVYDLRRLEAGSVAEPEARRWHLFAAAEATQHLEGLDPQAVALEILDDAPDHPGAIDLLETAALRARDTHRLLSVYRRIRGGTDDPVLSGRLAARIADLGQDVGDDEKTVRAIAAVIDQGEEGGEQALRSVARVAMTLERWALADRALRDAGATIDRCRMLEISSDDQKRVAGAWRAVLDADPDSVEAAAGLERAIRRLGEREGLAALHALLSTQDPDEPVRAMHALLAGHLHEQAEDNAQAIGFYKANFESNPFAGKAFDAMLRLHSEQGDGPAIAALFDALPQDDPIERAQALETAGAHGEAARIYRGLLDDAATPAPTRIAVVVRLEQALAAQEAWADLFAVLGERLALTKDGASRAEIEQHRRWILAERMADSDEAWEFYRRLHEEQPEDSGVLEALARIAGARGESTLAIQFLDGLANIAPSVEDAARYQRRIAEVHLANDDRQSARDAFLRAVDHLPADAGALAGLRGIAEADEDWKGLVGILNRELATAQGDERALGTRRIALIWEEKLGDAAVAMDTWAQVLELVRGNAEALQHLVDLSQQQEEWVTLIDHGRALVHYLEGEAKSDLLYRMGMAAFDHLAREDEAVRFLDEASAATVPSLESAEALERIHSARGAWDLVVEAILRQAQIVGKGDAAPLYLRAARMRRDSLRDRRGAAVIYEQVLAADSGNVEALEFRGSHLYESGDFEGAVGTFTELESLDLERDLEDFDVQMETALYYFRFGEALAQLGRTDEAIGRYEEALGLNQSHLPSLEAVAPLYVASEEWPKASKSLKQILQLTGGQGEPARLARVYANLGIVEHRQGSAEKAARRFDKALELAPNDVTALLGYAEILLARKDWPNLLNAYNNIIYHAQDRDEFIHAYLMKGFVLDTQMSLADKAAQHYEKCLTFDPAQPVALLRLSELALRQDDWERATSLVARALGATADPIEPGILAHLHLAEAAARSTAGDVEAMERALETAKGRDEDLDTALGETKGDAGALRTLLQERLKGGL